MFLVHQLAFSICIALFTFTFVVSSHFVASVSKGSTIYEVLQSNGLPMGLLPKGVTNFSLDNSGRFQVYLDQACNAKFENELHYDRNVSGTLTYGQIGNLSGISAQDLFLWFPVKEIRVDIPSSGLIYFDVGVVSKQFSLSSFETPRECLASPVPNEDHLIIETTVPQSQGLSRKLGRREKDHQYFPDISIVNVM